MNVQESRAICYGGVKCGIVMLLQVVVLFHTGGSYRAKLAEYTVLFPPDYCWN